jgi:hypothetical protein
MGLAAAAAAAVLYPGFGAAQWAGHRRVIIDLGPERPGYTQQARPLRASEVGHVLRDWGLRLVSGPSWSGTSYQAIAKDAAGRDVFVAVDPYDGRILRLDLADRELGGSQFASIPRGDERMGGESVRPLPGPGKPPALSSRERRNARAATRSLRPSPASSSRLAHRAASRRLATVETGKEITSRKPVAAAPSRPRGGASLGAAAKLTPAKAKPPGHELPATPAAAGVSASAPAAPPSPTPSAAEAPKLRAPTSDAQPSKPEIPKDAGFD